MKYKNDQQELNQIKTPLLVFMESYNKSIPVSFPVVSVKILKKFQVLHPVLFKNSNEWSIDKHRKRVMDWLPSYPDIS
ncbi:MAG: hypothetical protein A3I89_02930 [Candidatus Harrisonbacteria bacterium RIFCSPLOWO2_02_FULL_41_11]|uniref:Uncharacterized protein n=1 Tax=Candidatus Harrisonbacteria bacterium RIFCSPHIGHO2_02_FULL_42_16 TaxID=1798404 RepID=A0A1G1ZGX8_9BACT|nr:MAG: hypothetical protein A3B92_01365 [Candidatus Harrisonbacteria bacterium RIFCSPHIGHO2_02_FULL_42_16]OGY67334.1 MAG: hypothetical protein A3I89_02930 [Candidatus Harrisonbacteria bacterium RIFCSPLOWO2_02_FULL_41_11]